MPSADQVVRELYAAVLRGDWGAARGCLADEMTYVGLFEIYAGGDAYLAAFQRFMKITRRLEMKVIVGQGEEAAIFYEWETAAPAEGTTLIAEWHTIKNERIVRAQAAFDGRLFAPMFDHQP